MPESRRHLLTDPQTSGGLLIAVAPEHAEEILRTIRDAGYPFARTIGHAEAGDPAIKVAA
jgi:selenide,water dikinase